MIGHYSLLHKFHHFLIGGRQIVVPEYPCPQKAGVVEIVFLAFLFKFLSDLQYVAVAFSSCHWIISNPRRNHVWLSCS
jgi:hypothetical protein